MNIYALREALHEYALFSVRDIRKLCPQIHAARLVEWQKKGYLKKISKGFYCFSDATFDDSTLYLVANRLYRPSYVSFESALAYYQFIPEGPYGVTSASSLKTQVFKTPLAFFYYRHLKPRLMFGYRLIVHNQYKQAIRLAEPEKALLDFLYLNNDYKKTEDFDAMRIDREQFLERTELKKLKRYMDYFDNQQLNKRLNVFLEALSLC